MSSPIPRLFAAAVALPLFAIAAPAQAAAPSAPASGSAPSAPAGTSANQAGTLATCYGGAVRSYFATGGWGGQAGPYRTTSRCGDINVRNASPFSTQACVIFIDKTGNCNYWTYLPANSGWTVVASNVRDGVNFKVRFSNSYYQYEALTAYHAF